MNPFNPTSAAGVVLLGLIAIAIAAAARMYRAWLTPRLRHLLMRFPRRIIPILRRAVYFVYPTWRSYAQGASRTKNGIDTRLRQLRTRAHMPLVLVGGVYLDIWVDPVSLPIRRDMEVNDLDTVRAMPGGACFYVGKKLWSGFTRRSRLFTQIGRGDTLSKQLARLLKEEPWIKGDDISAVRDTQCGVSVHLVDRGSGFTPTFTHKGALGQFGWNGILRDLQHCTRRGGGVLYISSFFRTGLSNDLVRSINTLSPNVLVIIDHGRFQPEDNRAAHRVLLDAFRAAAIDIYVCTYSEITSFARGAGLTERQDLSDVDTVAGYAAERILPKVTIIRGDQVPGQPAAMLVIDGKVEVIRDGPVDWVPKSRPGSSEAFTAGLIDYFFTARTEESTDTFLADAVRAGLRHWAAR